MFWASDRKNKPLFDIKQDPLQLITQLSVCTVSSLNRIYSTSHTALIVSINLTND